MKILAERIKKARQYKGIDQAELAMKLNVHQVTVSGWERGYRLPGVTTVVEIAKALDCDPNYLLGWD